MRILRGLLVVLTLMLGFGGVASATQPDADAARQVLVSPDTAAKLTSFLGKLGRINAAPQAIGEPLAVYSLDPAFVAGTSGAPASFAYFTARAGGATVWVTREPSGWAATNFTTGTEEVTYPAQAGADLVFTEPQVNAWYRVRDGRVLALNDPARTRVGDGISLAAYQQVVHKLYGDKLAGSAYRDQGRLGGYDLAVSPARESNPWAFVIAAGLLALVLIGWGVARAVRGRH